jgi:hypothetical protein
MGIVLTTIECTLIPQFNLKVISLRKGRKLSRLITFRKSFIGDQIHLSHLSRYHQMPLRFCQRQVFCFHILQMSWTIPRRYDQSGESVDFHQCSSLNLLGYCLLMLSHLHVLRERCCELNDFLQYLSHMRLQSFTSQ